MMLAAALLLAFLQSVESTATAPFPNFESGPTRSLLLSADGSRLFALNTPDHRVELYDVAGAMTYEGAVFTGLEPVSMALHPDDPDTLFVANLLSDSLAVVDVPNREVVATIPVGDEPQGVVVADGQVFVAVARAPLAPDLITPSDFVDNVVVVVDAEAPYDILDHVAVGGHRPRALALADGAVHVVPVNSGNHTTILGIDGTIGLGIAQTDPIGSDPAYEGNPSLEAPELDTNQFVNNIFDINGWIIPATGRVVLDDEFPGRTPQLPDEDVTSIDVATRGVRGVTTGVGTTLFAIERNPLTGDLWVANTDARNRERFEPLIAGRSFENRVTIVAAAGGVVDTVDVEHSQPLAVAFAAKAGLAYVAALGTETVLVLDAQRAEVVGQIAAGPLPLGLAVDDAAGLLYVFTRGDNTIRRYDIAKGHAPTGRPIRLAYDPEPQGVAAGRVHLYDARASSGAGNGNMSCASCHVFGHHDQLAWDLGNPFGGLGYFYTDLLTGTLSQAGVKAASKQAIMTHPMKGPMTTQTLRGLGDSAGPPLHWRGDRRFFQIFRGAFEGLLGGAGLTPRKMQEYATFVRSISFPPNPLQPRDREYKDAAAEGFTLFGLESGIPGKEYNADIPGNVTCVSCHVADFENKTDFTGSQLTVNFDAEPQLFNTPQLRGLYEKEFKGITGFGLSHDGLIESSRAFLDVEFMDTEAFPLLTADDRDKVGELLLQWDTGTAPMVGAQITALAGSETPVYDWLDIVETQALPEQGNVDLIGKATVWLPLGGSVPVGLHFAHDEAAGEFRWRADDGRTVTRPEIIAAINAGLADVTFTAVPPGTGRRLGIDRDEDGLLDGVERMLGTDPASPDSDRDGFDDKLEVELGSQPNVKNDILPGDLDAPGITSHEVSDVFTTTASLAVVTDEPATLTVALGTGAGLDDLGVEASPGLRRRHDLVLDGLPAASEVHTTITATDKSGNASEAAGSFTTAPPFFHVDDITLDKVEADGQWTLTATATVVDHLGQPVDDVMVRGLWAGDTGGADFFPKVFTDASGTATFVVGPYAPAGATEVSFSVAYVGSNSAADTWHIGVGGAEPTFFYNQSFNAVNSRTVPVP